MDPARQPDRVKAERAQRHLAALTRWFVLPAREPNAVLQPLVVARDVENCIVPSRHATRLVVTDRVQGFERRRFFGAHLQELRRKLPLLCGSNAGASPNVQMSAREKCVVSGTYAEAEGDIRCAEHRRDQHDEAVEIPAVGKYQYCAAPRNDDQKHHPAVPAVEMALPRFVVDR